MGLQYVDIPLRGGDARLLEGALLWGEHGARVRFAAVGAQEELYSLAIRHSRHVTINPESARLEVGVVDTRDQVLRIGWTEAAGTMSMLAAYGVHLVIVAARFKGLFVGGDPPRPAGLGFAEIRGQLAMRSDDGFDLLAVRNAQPHALALADATTEERAIWEGLRARCMCPVCPSYAWTAEEADALAAQFERGEVPAHRLATALVRTPAIYRAAIRAGVYPGAPGKLGVSLWTSPPDPVVVRVGRELVNDKRVDVRCAAYAALMAGAHDAPDEAVALVRAALDDSPKVAIVALRGARWIPGVRERVIDFLIPEVTDTKNAELLTQALMFAVEVGRPLDDAARAALAPAVARLRTHKTGGRYIGELAGKLGL